MSGLRTERLILLLALALTPAGCGAGRTGTSANPTATAPRETVAKEGRERLAPDFAVFRRARARRDRLPRDAVIPVAGAIRSDSRAVGRSRHLRLWLVPGEHQLCVVERIVAVSAGAVGCWSASEAGVYSGHRPLGGLVLGPYRWRPHRGIAWAVLPDGTRSVVLQRGRRTMRRLRMTENAVIARARSATHLAWVAPDGSRRRMRLRRP